MKALKRILLFGIIAGMTLFSACEDDETETLDKEESQEVIQSNSQTMEKAMSELQETEGMKAVESLSGIVQTNDPFTDQKNLNAKQGFVKNISEIINPDKVYAEKAGDTQFVFGEHTGTYTWQSDSYTWETSDEPTDAIIIEYPADIEQAEKKAVLTVSAYEEEKIDGEWVVVDLTANLEIDGEEHVDIVYTVELDNEGNPSTVDMSLFMKPFTYTLGLTGNSIEFALSEEGTENTLLSANLNFTFIESETEIEGMEDIEEIEGNLQMGNINFDGWVKPHAFSDTASLFEGTSNLGEVVDNMNEQMDIEAYKFDSDEKMADLIFESFDTTPAYPIMGNITLVFEYNDGTTEEAGPYFKDIIRQIQGLTDELPEDNF